MSATSASVLLLEDDATDAVLIEAALEHALPGATVRRAANRREYLDLLSAGPVDLVLSDGNVPGCEGIDAFYLARRQTPGLPFLFITGGGRGDDPRALRALGVGALLAKDRLDEIGPAVARALSAGAPPDPDLDPVRLLAGRTLLLAAGPELTLARDLPALVGAALRTACRVTGADAATFAVRDGDECLYTGETSTGETSTGETSAAEHHAGEPAASWTGLRRPLGDCLSGWVMAHRQPLIIDDAATDGRSPRARLDGGATAGTSVAVPVRPDRPVAALAGHWTRAHAPDATTVRLLQELADQVATGLDNVQVKQALEARRADGAAEMSALTYAISHDLRAPIRHVEGFARIVAQDVAELGEGTRHAAQRVQDAAGHLREMVEGMLTLSRVAQSEVHPQTVDLAQMGREVAAGLNATRTGDPVEFVAPDHLPVVGDPRLLQSVLGDLLRNAWKFTARVSTPRVELGAQPGRTPSVIEIFVRDNGVGFEPGSADRLFGAFQRLHSPEDFPGTGVGLASVKRIVAKHGGSVRASGTPDAGAAFFFTLPATVVHSDG